MVKKGGDDIYKKGKTERKADIEKLKKVKTAKNVISAFESRFGKTPDSSRSSTPEIPDSRSNSPVNMGGRKRRTIRRKLNKRKTRKH